MVIGRIIKSLRGGVPLVFLGGEREIVELINYEEGKNGMIRLKYAFTEKFSDSETGYVFHKNNDFDPPLDKISWGNLGYTVIVCWKSRDGTKDVRPMIVKEQAEKIKLLTREVHLHKMAVLEVLQGLENTKLSEPKKKELVQGAAMLGVIRKLAAPESTGEGTSSALGKEAALFDLVGKGDYV